MRKGGCARRSSELLYPIGLRGETVKRYVGEDVVRIEDGTPFVVAQRDHVGDPQTLRTPTERVYPVTDSEVAAHLGIDA